MAATTRKVALDAGAPATVTEQKGNRDRFATGIGVLMATLGSAVGLGNIWKFPYLVGENGGAAFLIIYLLCTLLVGLPIMIVEHMLGRTGRGDAISALKRLAPGKPWWIIGAAGILSAFLIMAFYTEVAGWVFAYIVKSVSGGLLSTNPDVTGKAFTDLITSPFQSLMWQWIVLAVVGFIVLLGVTKGIEATTKRLMPVLFLLLIVIGVRSLTLPGAGEGLAFLFRPNFAAVTKEAVLIALGLAFFKLSIGMGTMITYGGYFRDDQNIPGTATRVVLSDLAVSLLAGIAIFPAVFAFGFQPASGPSLLFITIPSVFASMPMGGVFMVAFFVLAAIAANGAMLSLLEAVVAYLHNNLKMSRAAASILSVLGLAVVGSTAALSNSTLANFTPFGKTLFDLYDYVSSNILLPAGGLFLALFVGWFWGYPKMKEALSNSGALNNDRITRPLFLLLRFVTPVLVLVVLLSGLGLI